MAEPEQTLSPYDAMSSVDFSPRPAGNLSNPHAELKSTAGQTDSVRKSLIFKGFAEDLRHR